MKLYLIILLSFTLSSCFNKSNYLKLNDGNCVYTLGDRYPSFIIKHLKDGYYLKLFYHNDLLFDLRGFKFKKYYSVVIECPIFNKISDRAFTELTNINEYEYFIRSLLKRPKLGE